MEIPEALGAQLADISAREVGCNCDYDWEAIHHDKSEVPPEINAEAEAVDFEIAGGVEIHLLHDDHCLVVQRAEARNN